MFNLTNLSHVLKLLNLCFTFGCLLGDNINQKDKNHTIKICQTLPWVTASLYFTKAASLLVPLLTFIDEIGTSQLVTYPVVNKYFRNKLFPLF